MEHETIFYGLPFGKFFAGPVYSAVTSDRRSKGGTNGGCGHAAGAGAVDLRRPLPGHERIAVRRRGEDQL